MSELKRFGLIIDHTPFFKRNHGVKGIIDNKTKKRYKEYDGLKELLNQLDDENKQLKQVINEFIENPTQHNLWKLRTKGDMG